MLDKTKQTTINGLNVDDVQALIAAVQADPKQGETKWKATSQWQGRTHNRTTISSYHMGGEEVARDFTINVDEPEELGGGNAYANPQEHLLAAMNSCMMVGYVALCSLNNIRIDSLEIETTGDIDLRGFFGLDETVVPGYESLDYTVRISGDATPEQFEEIHRTVMKTSPNFHNISKPVTLNAKLVVG